MKASMQSFLLWFVAGTLLLISGYFVADTTQQARCQRVSDALMVPAQYASFGCYVKYPGGMLIKLF